MCSTKPLILQIQDLIRRSHSASLLTSAISYSVESDGDRRKQGLPSRVMFLNRSRTEADYVFNGTLELRGQKQKTCIKIIAKLKVEHLQATQTPTCILRHGTRRTSWTFSRGFRKLEKTFLFYIYRSISSIEKDKSVVSLLL